MKTGHESLEIYLFTLAGIFLQSVDRFNEEDDHQVTRTERSKLEEKTADTAEPSAAS